MSDDANVTIELNEAEALVLFELLTRWGQKGGDMIVLEDQAEYHVLWDIQATLESRLAAPFSPGYQNKLISARREIKDRQ